MTVAEVDGYLAGIEEPARSTLTALRASILRVLPDAEQCLSYGVPAFKVQGKAVVGFAAFKDHLSYLPHSGSVLSHVGDLLSGYRTTKGALQFGVGEPQPDAVVRTLIEARLRELGIG